ncbi:hypothetical protein B0H34DRAFT_797503 [Crassisporium funariophilum]|nr:hypothetical protein B0H34DRAFT_797503 [Crassisporium funariophilum]
MPIVELVWWSATDEFLSTLSSNLKPTLDYVSKANGCLAIYAGLEEEDSTNVWMAFIWQTFEHHKAMMERPDYPAMVARLKPYFRDGQMKMAHVEFNHDTAAAFSAPLTTVTRLTPKAGQSQEDLEATITNVGRVLASVGRGSHAPIAWGELQEERDQFLLVIGWDSLEIHREFSNNKDNKETIQELYDRADIQMVHVRLSKHTK